MCSVTAAHTKFTIMDNQKIYFYTQSVCNFWKFATRSDGTLLNGVAASAAKMFLETIELGIDVPPGKITESQAKRLMNIDHITPAMLAKVFSEFDTGAFFRDFYKAVEKAATVGTPKNSLDMLIYALRWNAGKIVRLCMLEENERLNEYCVYFYKKEIFTL